ncbi:hypothetical protein BCV70DRAFT_209739 [Testicularia cyperi]|uniref:Uncharacterized protein n=1 Tax=Testicularia cyperi TaxID=1882483 RepID=A0A317Y1B1_9BASI|nr:hypothetical protein BCV70DRAFT_209739 [Testicularia cyperi]
MGIAPLSLSLSLSVPRGTQRSDPSTPPHSLPDLPTPPTSHNEFRPPPNLVASSSRLRTTDEELPDASPTTTISEHIGPRRAAARLSGGSASFERGSGDESFSSQRKAGRRSSIDRNDERAMALELASKRSSYRSRSIQSPLRSPNRSLTPSPILGPAFAKELLHFELATDAADLAEGNEDSANAHFGHLSFPMIGVGVGPTKEEIELLVYGTEATAPTASSADAVGTFTEGSTEDVERMLDSLSQMGLDPPATEGVVSEREKELAGMVKLLASRCSAVTDARDRAQVQLKSTRLTALSVISSMRTAHAHTLASEQSTRDRLEAELDGWKAQAKMLSALLTRAEARGFDERRVATSSSSVFTGASSGLTFTEKARIAAVGGTNGIRNASIKSDDPMPTPGSASQPPASPAVSSSLPDPATPSVEEGLGRDRQRQSLAFAADGKPTASFPATTGLGISSTGLGDIDTDVSPTASLIRERNKLVTDKKHLKARLKDMETQVHRLENELKSLRPYLVSSGVKSAESHASIVPDGQGNVPSQPGTAPTTPSRSGSRKDRNRKKRVITMGDAETEHLMLAARRLRELRKEQAAASASSSSPDNSSVAIPAGGSAAAATASSSAVLGPPADILSAAPVSASPIKRQASEGPMTTADTEYERSGEPQTPPQKSAERPPKTPKSISTVPGTPRTGIRAREIDDIARGDDRRESWGGRHRRLDSASSFTGIDELLQAAETLNPGAAVPSPTLRGRGPLPPYSQGLSAGHMPGPVHDQHYYPPREPVSRAYAYPPLAVSTQRMAEYDPYGPAPYPVQSSPLRMAHESPKRRRVSSAAFDFEPYGSPFLGDRQPRIRTQTEGADPFSQSRGYNGDYAPSGASSAAASQGLSALDLLADQATASQNPSQGSDRSGGYEGVSPIGSLSSEDEMAVDAESRRKAGSRFASSRGGQSPAQGSKASSSNPGSGTRSVGGGGGTEGRSFGGNQNPEKRLPYVRWTAEEDSKLRSAIKEHGQRWELISRAVGTRSYHQCRQRYLLMRRKEAAAKAQAENEDGAPNMSTSASDQQSQESDYGQGPAPSSTSARRKSAALSHKRRDSRNNLADEFDGTNAGPVSQQASADSDYPGKGVTSTPLHKLSIGAPAPTGSVYGQFSPTSRPGPLGPPSSQTPTHSRTVSHPHGYGPSHGHAHGYAGNPAHSPSLSHPPSSPYSSQTPSATRRTSHYPPASPLVGSSRHLPPLTANGPATLGTGYAPQLPPLSPQSAGGHRRQFSGDAAANRHAPPQPSQPQGQHPPPSPTTPTSGHGPRRMGAALYS